MNTNALWASFWASCAAAIIGIAFASAWSTIQTPQPTAEQICAARISPPEFCGALLNRKQGNTP